MKRVVIILAVSLVFILPSATWGDEAQNYVTAGFGFYFYSGDISNETELDEAVIVEFAYGRFFHPNFALEVGAGYIHDDHSGDELQGWPFTLPESPVRLYFAIQRHQSNSFVNVPGCRWSSRPKPGVSGTVSIPFTNSYPSEMTSGIFIVSISAMANLGQPLANCAM